MEPKMCMNVLCGTKESIGWKKGWTMRSGEVVNLCHKCGSAYEQSVFCDMFHLDESGWRECISCGKSLHCGCIMSWSLTRLVNTGGVKCLSCTDISRHPPITTDEKPNGVTSTVDDARELQSPSINHHVNGNVVNLIHSRLCENGEGCNDMKDNHAFYGQMKHEQVLNQESTESSQTAKQDIHEPLAHTNLSISFGAPSANINTFSGPVVEERDQRKMSSSFLVGPRSCHIVPKPPKLVDASGMEENIAMVPTVRLARPPAEGRGRNQLLPRYWPRITDQELQQISGDSNVTIVPLFEKVLSASDAGRIGRLVLPKACAEAYFPPISQAEGLPLRIQDIKGKDWVFQFRFWPNNNSRMYVLEGVTPCIQSMQLQAGDTVTFSRKDPEGKIVMGFRKASNTVSMQDIQLSAVPNGALSSETFFPGVPKNIPIVSGYSGLLQSLNAGSNSHINTLSKHLNSASWNISWQHGVRAMEGPLDPSTLQAPDRKRSRNIGSKIKRLRIDSQEALELKISWDEAQDLLRPPPCIEPSTVIIEDHEFEEYEEPPVFGKWSIFTARSSGGQEQWAQCDSCSKWRVLPIDILLPPKWACGDNSGNQSRCSCSSPDELSPMELENLLQLYKDFKRRRITSHKLKQEHESLDLDTIPNPIVNNPSVATTTKHPRHRAGCSCIVCIQPPSGKGKHKPTCTCNVCMTVKRRFKTLMMRKKKRQSEHESEIATRTHQEHSTRQGSSPDHLIEESNKGQLDLNCEPQRKEVRFSHGSMMNLVQEASLPLEMYLKQNGLTSLMILEHQVTGAGLLGMQDTAGVENVECCYASDDYCEPTPDQSQNNTVV